ncbi:MAG: methyltransferase, partial [Mycobacterium sp.]
MADDPASQPQPSRAESIVNHAEQSISEDAIVAAARDRAVETGAGAVTPA